jgi:hypothetical protein
MFNQLHVMSLGQNKFQSNGARRTRIQGIDTPYHRTALQTKATVLQLNEN